MTDTPPPDFDSPDLAAWLARFDGGANAEACEALAFGLIGFDADAVVRRYNRVESAASGLSAARVLGQPVFTVVAPCMNNFMVAQRFEGAAAEGVALDATLGYVLTLRMKPEKVRLRLLATPGADLRHVLVQRRP